MFVRLQWLQCGFCDRLVGQHEAVNYFGSFKISCLAVVSLCHEFADKVLYICSAKIFSHDV